MKKIPMTGYERGIFEGFGTSIQRLEDDPLLSKPANEVCLNHALQAIRRERLKFKRLLRKRSAHDRAILGL